MNKIRKLQTHIIFGVAIIAVALLTSNPATAEHMQPDYPDFILDHNVPATVCQVWGGNQEIADYLSYSQYGRITNTHSFETLSVVCPISKNPQTSLASVEVFVTDNHFDSKVGCRLRKMNSHATKVKSSKSDSTAGLASGTGEDILYFPYVEHVASDGVAEFFVLFCTIPPQLTKSVKPSSINSIKIMEYEHPM
ncbi:hypothetical protein MNBD_GAMMA21-2916 [hydrothermal vent metagenome]|uniref:Uncharacterized protein n=1 Tax=hydrothermal vent metagenome TaxID=652676 RepID=A0A3B0ZW89_9ZZZZ